MSPPEHDIYMAEFRRLSDALYAYVDKIMPKKNQEDLTKRKVLTKSERLFWDLCLYWDISYVTNGDMFSWLSLIVDHKRELAAIGANGTLEAMDRLMPFYLDARQSADYAASCEHFWRTKKEREPIEALAEDMNEFARLLLQYAQNHLDKP
jgi:hypothetical protein